MSLRTPSLDGFTYFDWDANPGCDVWAATAADIVTRPPFFVSEVKVKSHQNKAHAEVFLNNWKISGNDRVVFMRRKDSCNDATYSFYSNDHSFHNIGDGSFFGFYSIHGLEAYFNCSEGLRSQLSIDLSHRSPPTPAALDFGQITV